MGLVKVNLERGGTDYINLQKADRVQLVSGGMGQHFLQAIVYYGSKMVFVNYYMDAAGVANFFAALEGNKGGGDGC